MCISGLYVVSGSLILIYCCVSYILIVTIFGAPYLICWLCGVHSTVCVCSYPAAKIIFSSGTIKNCEFELELVWPPALSVVVAGLTDVLCLTAVCSSSGSRWLRPWAPWATSWPATSWRSRFPSSSRLCCPCTRRTTNILSSARWATVGCVRLAAILLLNWLELKKSRGANCLCYWWCYTIL